MSERSQHQPATEPGSPGDAGARRMRLSPSPDDTVVAQPVVRVSPDQQARTEAAPSSIDPSANATGHREAIDGHDRFGTGEIAIVCSHYELGIIRSVLEFRRGSRRSPKVVLVCSRGKLLLKRRAAGRESAQLVAFSHAVQSHLNRRGFPLARLVPTRDGRTSVTYDGMVFELFEFIDGTRFDRSAGSTLDAGRALGQLHRVAATHTPAGQPANQGSYPAAPIVPASLHEIPSACSRPQLGPVCERLASVYERASARSRVLGVSSWPRQVVHCDYHPGNLVFAPPAQDPAETGSRVRAVLDFDACRIGPRAIDIANGALQFSVTRQGLDPADWPVELDMTRLRAFLTGYDGVPDCLLSKAELAALPWLMVEALVAEATMPIRSTGRFGQVEGGTFLAMVERKANWIMQAHEEIAAL